MSRDEKLLQRAMNNPRGLSFDEFKTLMLRCGWVLDHQTGSHQIWYSSKGYRISVQDTRDGKAKAYQVKQFLIAFEQEQEK